MSLFFIYSSWPVNAFPTALCPTSWPPNSSPSSHSDLLLCTVKGASQMSHGFAQDLILISIVEMYNQKPVLCGFFPCYFLLTSKSLLSDKES